MIDPNTIRRGNLFNVDGGMLMRMRVERFYIDENDQDCAIISSTTEFMKRTCACPIALLEGVPMTEELLLWLGFEWDMVTAMWSYDGIGVIDNGEQGFSLIPTPQDYLLSIPIPYIHDLQNIYFYLKGTEMPIKVSHFD
jgi:hypothetical protein